TEIAEGAELARAHHSNLAIQVARETAALRGFLLTGEEEFRDRYLEATDDEAAAFSELRSLVGRVDPDLAELVDRLAAYHSESHATGVELMAGRLARDRYLYDLMLQQA